MLCKLLYFSISLAYIMYYIVYFHFLSVFDSTCLSQSVSLFYRFVYTPWMSYYILLVVISSPSFTGPILSSHLLLFVIPSLSSLPLLLFCLLSCHFLFSPLHIWLLVSFSACPLLTCIVFYNPLFSSASPLLISFSILSFLSFIPPLQLTFCLSISCITLYHSVSLIHCLN